MPYTLQPVPPPLVRVPSLDFLREAVAPSLAFPAGCAPGFDQTHAAASATCFSGVASGANFLRLDADSPLGVKTSGATPADPTFNIDNKIGPCTQWASVTGKTSYITISGVTPNNVRRQTYGGIVYISTLGVRQYFLSNSNDIGNNTGICVGVESTDKLLISAPGVSNATSSNITMTTGWWFLGYSFDSTVATIYFVATNLATGQTYYETVSQAAFNIQGISGVNNSALGGNVEIGNNGSVVNREWCGKIAACMWANQMTSLAGMQAWARDPWSFWYPDKDLYAPESFQSGALGPSFVSVPAMDFLRQAAAPSLAFPAGVAPGFDPTHVAAKGVVRLSAISSGKTFVDILTGKPGTIVAAPTASLSSIIGPAMKQGVLQSDTATFARPVDNDYATIGGIFIPLAIGNINYVLCNDSASTNGIGLRVDAAGNLNFTASAIGGTVASNLVVSNGVPYFAAASWNQPVGANFVLVRLDTGQIKTQFVSSAFTPNPGNGTYQVANRSGEPMGQIAAVAYIHGIMSSSELLAWARDPWSFWYPDKDLFAPESFEIGSTVLPVGVPQIDLPRLGPAAPSLAYPAGVAPGFDPTHIGASGPVRFSVVAMPTGILDVMTGAKGANTGAPSFGVNGSIGAYFGTASNAVSTVSGKSTVLDSAQTLACIVVPSAFTAYNGLVDTSTAAGGWYLAWNGNATSIKLGINSVGETGATLNGTLVANRPYLVIGSINSNTFNVLVKDLLFGQVYTGTNAHALSFSASNGTMGIGCISGLGGGNFIAAVMSSACFLSLSKMQAWATDPWGFWYPDKDALAPESFARGLYDFLPYTAPSTGGGGTTYTAAAILGMIASAAASAAMALKAASTIAAKATAAGAASMVRAAASSIGIKPNVAGSPAASLKAAATLAMKEGESGTLPTGIARAASIGLKLGISSAASMVKLASGTVGLAARVAGTAKSTMSGAGALAAKALVAASPSAIRKAAASIGMKPGEGGAMSQAFARAGTLAAKMGLSGTGVKSLAKAIVAKPVLLGTKVAPRLLGSKFVQQILGKVDR